VVDTTAASRTPEAGGAMTVIAQRRMMSAWAESDARNSSTVVALLVGSGLLLPSVLLWLLPVNQRVIGFAFFVVAILFLGVSQRTIPTSAVLLLTGSVLLSTITAIYWGTVIAVILIGYFALGLILTAMASLRELQRTVEVATVILLALIILAWIGASYALQGGQPLWTITTVGQPVKLFLTTFAVDPGFAVIRPAGIFDEPGAFAFFIALCASCRMCLDMPRGRTWALLLGGLVTASLALLIFVVVVGVGALLSRRRRRIAWSRAARRRARIAVVLGLALIAFFVVRYTEEITIVSEFLIDRLMPTPDSDRLIQGDSRTRDMLISLEHLDVRTFFFGIDRSCFTDVVACYAIEMGGGTNPVAPIVLRGILSQFLYYLVLAVLLFKAVTGPHRAVYLAVALMYLQRPYVLAFGYSTWAAMILLLQSKVESASLHDRVPAAT
jgi:hypothetical protein